MINDSLVVEQLKHHIRSSLCYLKAEERKGERKQERADSLICNIIWRRKDQIFFFLPTTALP